MSEFPTFAIVTPSLNQADYIGETIESVITQKGDFYIDYVIMDGVSADHSVDVIKEYDRRIKAGDFNLRCRGVNFNWVSQKDRNKYDALNEGFRRTKGDYMAWINSDDVYMPWAFSVVADVFGKFDDIRWLTSMYPMSINARGQAIDSPVQYGFSRRGFYRGMNFPGQGWFHSTWIQQDCVFWTRSLWDDAGATLDTNLKFAGDFELWSRFIKQAELPVVTSQLAAFRFHQGSEVGSGREADAYAQDVSRVFQRIGGRPPGRFSSFLRRQIAWRLLVIPLFSRVMRSVFLKTGVMDLVPVVYQSGNSGDWSREYRNFLSSRLGHS